jgi:N-acetylmuramoyl-L-alanine amidase
VIPRRLTIHCTATPNGISVPVSKIRELHASSPETKVEWFGQILPGRGWKDVGYHYVIDVDGKVSPGRPVDQVGAHVEGHNQENLGICLVGSDRFTVEQWNALRELIKAVLKKFLIPPWEIHTHNLFTDKKECPGFAIQRLMTWFCWNDSQPIKPHLLLSESTSRPLGR